MDVVSADWVVENRDRIRLVDVRDAWEYDGIGHLPGAVNVPFNSFRADEHGATGGDETGMLPGADVFVSLFGGAGVAPADDVVAYDDHHGVFAARLLVTAALYGHPAERLHLLDGDFSAWQRERETTTAVPEPSPADYAVREPADSPVVDADEVAAAADDPGAVVVDTREEREYAAGHVPGAVRLDWRELVDDETRGLKPRETLESILIERGVTPDRRVVLYCNTARRISHTYVVLRHLGYEDVGFYEGSLTEWAAAGRPVEREDG